MRSARESRPPSTAIGLTVVALVSVNVVLAYAIARAIGVRGIDWPLPVPVAIGVAGVIAGIVAIARFRTYIVSRRRDG